MSLARLAMRLIVDGALQGETATRISEIITSTARRLTRAVARATGLVGSGADGIFSASCFA